MQFYYLTVLFYKVSMILTYNILWRVMSMKKERDIEIIYKDGEVDFDYINTMISFIINLICDVEKEEKTEKN